MLDIVNEWLHMVIHYSPPPIHRRPPVPVHHYPSARRCISQVARGRGGAQFGVEGQVVLAPEGAVRCIAEGWLL